MRISDSARTFLRATVVAGLSIALARPAAAQSTMPVQPKQIGRSDETAIRAARAASNAAIAAHDADAVARAFDADFISLSSTNARDVGRDAARATYQHIFASRPGVLFVRTPDRITVNAAWRQAGEAGTWTGRWSTQDGDVHVGGTYFAKWRQRNGEWLLLAETFVLTKCDGARYCASPQGT